MKSEAKKNSYHVMLMPRIGLPNDGWDAAILNVRMIVRAESEEEAQEKAVHILETKCNLYLDVVQSNKIPECGITFKREFLCDAVDYQAKEEFHCRKEESE